LSSPKSPSGSDVGATTPGRTDASLARLLADVEAFYRRFLATLGDAHFALLAVWTAHTYVVDLAYATVYLHVTSAERGSGKSRLLEVANLVVCKPSGVTVNISGAALLRELDAGDVVTLLLDEVDNFLHGGRVETEARRDVLGILNSGYTRGATAARTLGAGTKGERVRRYRVFGPKVLTGLGELPDTLESRSLRFGMKKRTSDEVVERLRIRTATKDGQALRNRLEAWSCSDEVRAELDGAEPWMPEELEDRLMDAAEQLVAIADLAGEAWSSRVRDALVTVSQEGRIAGDGSLGMRLLADLLSITTAIDRDRYSMAELVDALNELAESEWSAWHRGAGFSTHDLGRLLKPYGIRARTIALGDQRPKGYTAVQFSEPFRRYQPKVTGAASDGGRSSRVTGSPSGFPRQQNPVFEGFRTGVRSDCDSHSSGRVTPTSGDLDRPPDER
jgi:hypothetical protein